MEVLGAIAFLWFFIYFAIYKPTKEKKLKEDSQKAIIKTSEYLQKISESKKNNELIGKIEKLEKEIQELKNPKQ